MKVENYFASMEKNISKPKMIGTLAGVFIVIVLSIYFLAKSRVPSAATAKKTDSYFSQFKSKLLTIWHSFFCSKAGEKSIKSIETDSSSSEEDSDSDSDSIGSDDSQHVTPRKIKYVDLSDSEEDE